MHFFKIIFVGFLILPVFLHAELMSIQVKQTSLRAKPSFLSKPIAKLSYAQKVEDRKVKNGWHFVKSIKSGTVGWVHGSALSEKSIVLNSSKKLSNSSVSQSEVLMAGKGFNKQVETEYKEQNKNLNFKEVDKLESSKGLTRTQLIRFAKNGKLSI